MTGQVLKPIELAERWQCSADHVRDLIHSCRLPAFKIGGGHKRPRYRITLAAVLAYEAGEQLEVVRPRSTRRASRRTEGVIEFYK